MKSPELKVIEAEEAGQEEPSLDKMFNLNDPKTLKAFGNLAQWMKDNGLYEEPSESPKNPPK
jgi:hypothetical protein